MTTFEFVSEEQEAATAAAREERLAAKLRNSGQEPAAKLAALEEARQAKRRLAEEELAALQARREADEEEADRLEREARARLDAQLEIDQQFYAEYLQLALAIAAFDDTAPLDSRLALYPVPFEVNTDDPDAPFINVNFENNNVMAIEADKVKSETPIDTASEAFAMAAFAKAISNGRAVTLKDCESEFELVLAYLAAKELGLKVANKDDIESVMRRKTYEAETEQAKQAWEEFKAGGGLDENDISRLAAEKLAEAKGPAGEEQDPVVQEFSVRSGGAAEEVEAPADDGEEVETVQAGPTLDKK